MNEIIQFFLTQGVLGVLAAGFIYTIFEDRKRNEQQIAMLNGRMETEYANQRKSDIERDRMMQETARILASTTDVVQSNSHLLTTTAEIHEHMDQRLDSMDETIDMIHVALGQIATALTNLETQFREEISGGNQHRDVVIAQLTELAKAVDSMARILEPYT